MSTAAARPRAATLAAPDAGLLIVNADDWGRDRRTTQMILDCVLPGAVSSVSAMVFMEDSERAAEMARDRAVDTGLHLNFTTPFSAARRPAGLVERQQQLTRYLRGHRFAQAVFHPGLVRSFEYVAKAQFDEYQRLYGNAPDRVDGHHHMHLCANVMLGKLLPPGIVVRRNFSFEGGEKGPVNRLYRRLLDGALARRHRLVDFLFPLAPFDDRERLARVFSLARRSVVEVETHPVNADEYDFLTGGDLFRRTGDRIPVSHAFVHSVERSR
jgi:predicted glycoside hydrolase/deacetylase ChbG (UPF0249 family)